MNAVEVGLRGRRIAIRWSDWRGEVHEVEGVFERAAETMSGLVSCVVVTELGVRRTCPWPTSELESEVLEFEMRPEPRMN